MAKKSKPRRSYKSSDDRKAEVKAVYADLAEGVKALTSTEEWTRWLGFQSSFYKYSWGNTMLIAMQCPDATHVASFSTWKKLGRTVKKGLPNGKYGYKGIRILAPNGYAKFTKEKENSETGETEKQEFGFMRFKTVSCFDISMTEGEPVPVSPKVERLKGDDDGLLGSLVAFAEAKGAKVTFTKLEGELNGRCWPKEKRIEINEALEPAQKAKTMAHEIGHMLMHHSIDREFISRDDKELEAESVAYVVCKHFGLETASYSFGYLACWKGQDASKGLRESAGLIQKTAQEVIEGLESPATRYDRMLNGTVEIEEPLEDKAA